MVHGREVFFFLRSLAFEILNADPRVGFIRKGCWYSFLEKRISL